MRKLAAEVFGTNALVFAGTGAAVINDVRGGVITHVGVALFAGPISGASMNPARSFAPAIVSQHTENLWIYLIAPLLGACVSVPIYRFIHDDAAELSA